MKEAILQARGLNKAYPMGDVVVHALRGVDLDVHAGELLVIVGVSGSGKSTLLNILGGLDSPSSGQLLYRDKPLRWSDDAEVTRYRRECVGFVFQFYNLIPTLTALENVALVTEISRDPMPPREALALVGLDAERDRFPSQLSGGQQQRVAVARAVAKRPDMLLCDEPTGALDFATGRLVLEVLQHINERLGTTTAIITHNRSIGAMADRVLTFADGRIVGIQTNPERLPPSELAW